ncbi:MAG: hypothetical protein MJ001_03255 [Paludibacteraceae bacterium]|nr:hypothetical protein [Candidatus Colousia faecequi]MCQ2337928.1 hypothetical protein [Paludibacteraceae bacterium]
MFNTIDEVRRERHRLERRAEKQEKSIKSQYKSLKNNPFGDSKIYAFIKTAANLGHFVAFLKKFRSKK